VPQTPTENTHDDTAFNRLPNAASLGSQEGKKPSGSRRASLPNLRDNWQSLISTLPQTLSRWPWLETARTLRQRFREDRLGLTASSLTFTTLIALVPLLTVMLAVFSSFPMFAGFQLALEKYFLQNLVPPNIAQPVLKAITQFTNKATQMGSAGLVALVVTALALVFTIDRTLNAIWRVRKPRPLHQRMLIHWAAITLAPLLVGVSLTLMTYLLSNTTRTARSMSATAEFFLHSAEFLLFVLAVSALFRYVPNTYVKWRHALAGAVFVAIGLQAAKRILTWYVGQVPIYASVYGAFATLPIFLLWLYVTWVIVLLGAVIAAYAPSLGRQVVAPGRHAGQRFTLALALLRELHAVQGRSPNGMSLPALAETLKLDTLVVEPVLGTLIDMDWVARLEEQGAQRHVLLVDPDTTSVEALSAKFLLEPSALNQSMVEHMRLDDLMLTKLLQPQEVAAAR
jgi:membrane protein